MGYTLDNFKKFPLLKEKRIDVLLDSLTGLLNRGSIISLANRMIDADEPFSMYILDIDNFKSYNESFGHLVGDKILQDVAEEFIKATDENTVIGRFGGDEFLAISYQFNYDDMWKFSKNVLDKIRKCNLTYLKTQQITITCGASLFPNDANDFQELLTKADKALYRGKAKGRNCFIIYTDSLHKNVDLSNKTESITEIIDHIYLKLNSTQDLDKRFYDVFEFVCGLYSLSGYFIMNKKKNVIKPYCATKDLNPLKTNLFLETMGTESNLILNDYSKLIARNPLLHEYCWNNKIKSFAAIKVYAFDKVFGTLLFVDYGVKRIWQKDDKIVLTLLGQMFGLLLYYSNPKKKKD